MKHNLSIFVLYYLFSKLIEEVDSIANNEDCGDNKYMPGNVFEVNKEAKEMKKVFEKIKDLNEEELYNFFLREEITGSDDSDNEFNQDHFRKQVEEFSKNILVGWLYGESQIEESTIVNLKTALKNLLDKSLRIRVDGDFRDNMNNFGEIIADFVEEAGIDYDSVTEMKTFESNRVEMPYEFYNLYSMHFCFSSFVFNAIIDN